MLSRDGENLQEQMLRRVGSFDGPYVAEDRSEATTLANLYKRGWLDRERIGGRWCYQLRVEPLAADGQQQGVI